MVMQTSEMIDKLVLVTGYVLEMRCTLEAGRHRSALSHQAEDLLREVVVALRGEQAEYTAKAAEDVEHCSAALKTGRD